MSRLGWLLDNKEILKESFQEGNMKSIFLMKISSYIYWDSSDITFSLFFKLKILIFFSSSKKSLTHIDDSPLLTDSSFHKNRFIVDFFFSSNQLLYGHGRAV